MCSIRCIDIETCSFSQGVNHVQCVRIVRTTLRLLLSACGSLFSCEEACALE